MVDEDVYLARLGFWLRMARERSGQSQEGVARELGLSAHSKSTISDWENGLREPKGQQLRSMSRYYRVPLDVFLHPPPTAFEQLDEWITAAEESEEKAPPAVASG